MSGKPTDRETDAQNARAPFITFEGGDGAGKSTQIRLLADYLRTQGVDPLLTREPGGAPSAEAVRALLVAGEVDAWTPLGETLMMYAARAEHLARTINPARAAGRLVVSDRFADSTMAYQGAAGGVEASLIERLHEMVVGADGPDRTIILDLPADAGLERAERRAGDDGEPAGEHRFEDKGAGFQARVREAFLDIAAKNPARCVVVDARGAPEEVAVRVRTALAPLIAPLLGTRAGKRTGKWTGADG